MLTIISRRATRDYITGAGISARRLHSLARARARKRTYDLREVSGTSRSETFLFHGVHKFRSAASYWFLRFQPSGRYIFQGANRGLRAGEGKTLAGENGKTNGRRSFGPGETRRKLRLKRSRGARTSALRPIHGTRMVAPWELRARVMARGVSVSSCVRELGVGGEGEDFSVAPARTSFANPQV